MCQCGFVEDGGGEGHDMGGSEGGRCAGEEADATVPCWERLRLKVDSVGSEVLFGAVVAV